jgi:hypothetical protein
MPKCGMFERDVRKEWRFAVFLMNAMAASTYRRLNDAQSGGLNGSASARREYPRTGVLPLGSDFQQHSLRVIVGHIRAQPNVKALRKRRGWRLEV